MLNTKIPAGYVLVIVALFVLWIGWSTDSQWTRGDDGVVAATSHEVGLGILSYVEIQATRADASDPWSVSAGVRGASALLTLLLTVPVLWLGYPHFRRTFSAEAGAPVQRTTSP